MPDAGFTPATLGSRLVLWLDADRGFNVLDAGLTWVDNSPALNDAHQTDSTRCPHRLPAGATGGLAGHGLIAFTGNQYVRIEDADSLRWSSSDFYFYVVLRQQVPLNGYGIVYAKWTDSAPLYTGFFLWANYPYTPWDGNAFTGFVGRFDTAHELIARGSYNDDTLHLISVYRDGALGELRIDGTSVVQGNASGFDLTAFDAVGNAAVVGGRADPWLQGLQGEIAEIVAFKGTLTAGERAEVESYLLGAYGL